MEELHALVSGRVQMVMMRDFIQRRARRLGLSGYAKNLRDGRVEVVAQGEKAKLSELVAELHKGSVLARVDSVEVSWRKAEQAFSSFEIVYE